VPTGPLLRCRAMVRRDRGRPASRVWPAGH
jgi:hypothetical protein